MLQTGLNNLVDLKHMSIEASGISLTPEVNGAPGGISAFAWMTATTLHSCEITPQLIKNLNSICLKVFMSSHFLQK